MPCIAQDDGAYHDALPGVSGRHSDAACKRKQRPRGLCPKGRHLSLGTSTIEDDWACTDCPTGTFAASENDDRQCTVKTSADACFPKFMRISGTCHGGPAAPHRALCRPQ